MLPTSVAGMPACRRVSVASVLAIGLRGETDPELTQHVDVVHWVRLGQLGAVVRALRSEGVVDALMLGKVEITHLFSKLRPDLLRL